jgi:hypothetical protein
MLIINKRLSNHQEAGASRTFLSKDDSNINPILLERIAKNTQDLQDIIAQREDILEEVRTTSIKHSQARGSKEFSKRTGTDYL